MSPKPDASVRRQLVVSECFIKPKHHLEEHSNPVYLNTWDMAMLSIRYLRKGLLYQYVPQQPIASSSSSDISKYLDQLKEALSVALVSFHPLAGQLETIVRLSTNQNEEGGGHRTPRSLIFIDPMKGPGARFIHATVDLAVTDLLSSTEIPHAVHLLFDDKDDDAVNHDGHDLPLLTVQVTELLDGIFIGCSMNHVCADGSSYWHFLNCWSDVFMTLSNGGDDRQVNTNISTLPIHTRWFLDGFGPIIELPFSHPGEFMIRPCDPAATSPPLRERIFCFSSESIRKVKSWANSDSGMTTGNKEISSFQALSALVWRCVTRARRVPADEETACHIAVNNRGRLKPSLPDNYFGNCVQGVKATATAGELLRQSLGWAAMRLNQAISAHGDREVRESVAAWLKNPKFYEARTMPAAGGLTSFDVYMVGSSRFNVYGNEFGLGKPVAAFKAYGSKDGNVFSSPGSDGAGSIDLQTCFLHDTMLALEMDEEFIGLVSS